MQTKFRNFFQTNVGLDVIGSFPSKKKDVIGSWFYVDFI